MQGLKDPEAKRKAIGAGFIEVFNDFAAHFDRKPKYLVQVRNFKLAITIQWHVWRRGHSISDWVSISDHACQLMRPSHAGVPAAGNAVSRCHRVNAAARQEPEAQPHDQIAS